MVKSVLRALSIDKLLFSLQTFRQVYPCPRLLCEEVHILSLDPVYACMLLLSHLTEQQCPLAQKHESFRVLATCMKDHTCNVCFVTSLHHVQNACSAAFA